MEDKRTRRMWPFIILIVVGLVVGGLGIFLIAHRPKEAPQQPAGGVTNQPNTAPASQPAASILRQKKKKPKPPATKRDGTGNQQGVQTGNGNQQTQIGPTNAPIKLGGNAPCQANSYGGNATVKDCNAGPPPLKIQWSVRDQEGGNANWHFEKIVTVTPNVQWQPVSISITCDQSVRDIFPEGIFMSPQKGFDSTGKIVSISYANPPQAANVPVSFEVFSDQDFRVLDVKLQ